jgi:hypothetical protein
LRWLKSLCYSSDGYYDSARVLAAASREAAGLTQNLFKTKAKGVKQ